MKQPKQKRGRPKGLKCNCHEWALIGSYFCPVHGNQNWYRQKNKYYIAKAYQVTEPDSSS